MKSFVRHHRERLLSTRVGGRLLRGALWSLVGTVLARGLGLLSSIFVARLLGKQIYGQLGIIQSTIEMFGIVAGFGMGLTATKYVAELRRSDPARAGRIIGLCSMVSWVTGGALALTLAVFAPWLAEHSLGAPQLGGLLRLGSISLFLGAVNGAQVGVLAGFEAFRVRAQITLIAGLIQFPLMVGGVFLAGVQGAVCAMVAGGAVNCFLNFRALRREAKSAGIVIRFQGWRNENSLLWKFSIPAVLSGLMYSPVAWAANVLLVNQPLGYGQMGVYNAANQWQNLLLLLPNIFASVALPILSSSMVAGKAGGDYQSTFRMSYSIAVLVAFPMCAILMFSGEWLLRLYGKGFSEGAPVLSGILLSALIQCIGVTCGPAIQAKGKMWVGFYYNLAWGCLFLAGAALSIPRFGAAGLAFSAAAAYALSAVWAFWYMRNDLPQGLMFRAYVAVLSAIALSASAIVLPSFWRLILAAPVALISLLAAVFVFSDPTWRASILKRNKPVQHPIPEEVTHGY